MNVNIVKKNAATKKEPAPKFKGPSAGGLV
jgi:hypothetical protein